jgi:hypothetical protein
MAQRRIQKPKLDASSNRGVYDDQSAHQLDDKMDSLVDRGGESARAESQRAGNLVDNIDDLLGQEEAPGSPKSPNRDRENTDAKGFYSGDEDKPDKVADKSELNNAEKGFKYTGDGEKKSSKKGKDNDPDYGKNFMARLNNSSKFKKRLMIAGAAAGGSLIGGILIFLAMLPLKIEHVVDNLQGHFAAASQNALDSEAEVFYDKYMFKKVIPHLGKGSCRSTLDASCISDDSSVDTPLGKFMHAAHETRL